MIRTIRIWISCCLIAVFVLDHAAMFVNAVDLYPAQHTEEAVCGCTCCGDVCPMGADCCCYEKNKKDAPKRVPLQFDNNACSPNPFQHNDYSLFFTSVKWLEKDQTIMFPNAASATYSEGVVLPLRSWLHKPPTPPPNA
ncbi:hypothetical protein K8I31_05005 [bacterium]|nr:hypothetical protein [bacterium]